MDFNWLAINFGEVAWIAVAFVLGLLSRAIGLPPMIGFLLAGFLLGAQGVESGPLILKISDLGITLLLFTIGLKLNPKTLARPQVWGVASLHMAIVCGLFGLGIFSLATFGLSAFAGLDLADAFLVAFALSFSSTVYAVKALEERGEMASLQGRITIGVLIVQDIAAVIFLAVSTAKLPSAWALLLIAALIPLRPLLRRLLEYVGHGELLVLYGLVLALGGAELFELVGMKGDLGALVMGVLIASLPKADELNKTMMGFKDLFLLGFFMSVGLTGSLTTGSFLVALCLLPLVLFKSALFFTLFTRLRLRSRTAFFAAFNLGNYSEFGLIVAALAASQGWISFDWLVIVAVALSISFVLAALLNRFGDALYDRFRDSLLRFQHPRRLADDPLIDVGGAGVVVIGMGRIGTSAFDEIAAHYPGMVIGVDTDPLAVARLREDGKEVVWGNPGDPDFWDRVEQAHTVELVMLTPPTLSTTLAVIKQLKGSGYDGKVAAIARYPDEVQLLESAGVDAVFNIYSEAGSGFAAHAMERTGIKSSSDPEIL